MVPLKGIQIVGFQFRDWSIHLRDEMTRNEGELLELLASGRAEPHIGAEFPLEKAAEALRYVGDGKAIGKVVLAIP